MLKNILSIISKISNVFYSTINIADIMSEQFKNVKLTIKMLNFSPRIIYLRWMHLSKYVNNLSQIFKEFIRVNEN
jgi:uncharacterized protein YggT (Ycf19 family)